MAEKVMVVLKRSENSGFGFSLLGTTGLPHVIYDIVENSPAADSGEVEAGDIIVKVNGIDVHGYTTKEVLRCLRLSKDSVALELKRDPAVKAHIKEHLARTSCLHHSDVSSLDFFDIRSTQKAVSASEEHTAVSNLAFERINTSIQRKSSGDSGCRKSRIPTAVKSPAKTISLQPSNKKARTSNISSANGHNVTKADGCGQSVASTATHPSGKARFEAFMMTGDLILNLSRTPQSNSLIVSQAKKVDSLRDSPQRFMHPNGGLAPRASGESTPSSSSSFSDDSEYSTKNKSKVRKAQSASNKQLDEDVPSEAFCDYNEEEALSTEKNSEFNKNEECVRGGGGDDERLVISCNEDLSGFVSSSSSSINKTDNVPKRVAECGRNINESEHYPQPSSSSSSTTVKSEGISSTETSFSMPASPISLSTPLIDSKDIVNSAPTSPEQCLPEVVRRQHNGIIRKCDAAGFRTSKSEDHLQQIQRDGLGTVVPIDIDEDINSSLNTLLDTRHDSDDSQIANCERIVWTYNAPITNFPNTKTSPSSHSSSISSSPQRSDSPASPTSVSSSVMSSNSGSKATMGGVLYNSNTGLLSCPANGDQSVSEAVSNISSPDYQDDDNLLSSKDLAAMALSDPSDSDSTILVKSGENQIGQSQGYSELKDSEDELATITEDSPTVLVGGSDQKEASPPVSDDGSDVDSLHSYHYSPKAVDMPSAIRLAKRLYYLDGFKKSDVSRHLSKNNDFSRAVADEYLKFFNFGKQTLDESLRDFLQQFALSGETQERERVLVHFSKRYLDCNPGTFNSQDAVHTLTCAIMLLNTDLHGPNIGRKMTCAEFIDNLVELNDGENFPKDVLKYLYQAIKNHPLEWALDEEFSEQQKPMDESNLSSSQIGTNPFLDAPQSAAAIEYKKGYVMRKCCFDSNYKKNCFGFILAPFGKRSWKMFYCTLRDLVLYLHKDEHGFRKSQMSDNVHNAIRIHHALATKAIDYTKKQHVFRLQTADQSEYLFQTSDSKELQSWIDTINFVCAAFSAPPLEGGVGSQKRFQRPLLPSTHTKFLLSEQLAFHEQQVTQLENALTEHKQGPIPSKGLPLQNYKEKEAYLQYELKRYKTYANVLNVRLSDQQVEMQNCPINSEDRFPTNRPILSSTGQVTQNLGNSMLQGHAQQQGNRQDSFLK
ncbi:unnamed protein product [Hermetia illucens]|uniref:PH and SEC7 domain-containing protein 4 n=1 Tax=Hermetia illucens TaxID=343691 RepID=A0A7R8YUJ8_HERIL|nr:unnamed protein product [Hermetia illucens]